MIVSINLNKPLPQKYFVRLGSLRLRSSHESKCSPSLRKLSLTDIQVNNFNTLPHSCIHVWEKQISKLNE